jgi:hypothetical protein
MTFAERCDHCAGALEPGVRYCPHCGGVVMWLTPTAETPRNAPAFVLVHRSGGPVVKVPLEVPVVRVGRGRDCEVRVDHPRVSRLHAVLEVRGRAWLLSDARSSGGTFLGDRPVHGPTELRSGDTIRLGLVPDDCATLVFHLGE